ncbi:hypothetical protein DCAR_0623064 [Daucus carota subsp. sativus]|uniref:Uncharacterized protein n=1 Tax=Daucus carota subsp. sativus TaxID=79200 RepID=A0AAF1B2H2_DAUCS|nr:PREDICTED: uncharacterized protein LOC108225546 [Daucus carota subsp. sativus]WOH03665.1 hypothetical protein DCAR_0623064 [Daucus carota subsp. sativus]
MTNSGRKTSANSKKQASVEFVSGVPEENTVANQRITRSMKNGEPQKNAGRTNWKNTKNALGIKKQYPAKVIKLYVVRIMWTSFDKKRKHCTTLLFLKQGEAIGNKEPLVNDKSLDKKRSSYDNYIQKKFYNSRHSSQSIRGTS